MTTQTSNRRARDHSVARPLRAGITLIELMVVLVIIAILLAASLPIVAQALTNKRAYDASREITSVIKSQRYKAQNLNRAVGFNVSANDNKVYTYVSNDNSCTSLAGSPNATTAVDVSAEFVGDAQIRSTGGFVDTVICIRPDGAVVDPATGQPYDNGPVSIDVGRSDGIGSDHTVVVPYNGVARLGN